MSLPAISQILNKKGNYRPETRERVTAAAASLGYRPNAYAQAMTTGRFQAAALIVPSTRTLGLVSNELLAGVEASLASHGNHLLVASLPDEQLTNDGYVPSILSKLMVDGLLIAYNSKIPDRMVQLMGTIPSVWINSLQMTSSVYPDDRSAAIDVTKGLIALGHRNIAYGCLTIALNEEPWHYSANARKDGYCQAMSDAGLAPLILMPALPLRRADYLPYAREVFHGQNEERPSALICYTAESAYPFTLGAIQSGITVPGELAIATFDEAPAAALGLQLATMVIPSGAMAMAAVEMLFARLAGDEAKSRALPFNFDPGMTWTPLSS